MPKQEQTMEDTINKILEMMVEPSVSEYKKVEKLLLKEQSTLAKEIMGGIDKMEYQDPKGDRAKNKNQAFEEVKDSILSLLKERNINIE